MKPKKYVREEDIGRFIQIKARRRGITFDFMSFHREHYTTSGIPKWLPRKEKKRRYGTKSRRKHLAIALIENRKAIEAIVDCCNPKRSFPLTILTKSTNNDKS
jgi:hypothetical protein